MKVNMEVKDTCESLRVYTFNTLRVITLTFTAHRSLKLIHEHSSFTPRLISALMRLGKTVAAFCVHMIGIFLCKCCCFMKTDHSYTAHDSTPCLLQTDYVVAFKVHTFVLKMFRYVTFEFEVLN